METAAPQSSHHLPYPIQPELENVFVALVAANARNGELEKKVAEEPTPPSTKELDSAGAALVAANVRIGELEKQVAEEPTTRIPCRPSAVRTAPISTTTATRAQDDERQISGAGGSKRENF